MTVTALKGGDRLRLGSGCSRKEVRLRIFKRNPFIKKKNG